MTGSTMIALPRTQPFPIITNTFHICSARVSNAVENMFKRLSCFCKRLSNDDVGVARGTMFHEIRPGAGFETGDFVRKKLVA